MVKDNSKSDKDTKNKDEKLSLMKRLKYFCIKFLIVTFIWFSIVLVVFIAYCSVDLPDVTNLLTPKTSQNIKILYSNGDIIKNYGVNDDDITNNYAEFPFDLINALLSTEDRKFFNHSGFDYFGILRALFVNIKYGSIKQGGSTITQQLAKILLQNSKKHITRKVQELLLSIQLERKMTKEQILTLYLNKSYFGAGQYGIRRASKFYFHKGVSDLKLEESAMLVGLLKAPSKYSPQNNPELASQRTKQVLINMKDAGFLQDVNFNESKIEEVTAIATHKKLNEEMYFADYVKTQLDDYTDDKNIVVKTTLNLKIQNAIENTIKELKPKHQVAVIALNKSGKILGMAGGTDYNKSEFNRAIYGSRQVGSAFKLFVFLAGMEEKNYTPNSIFRDEPVAVGNWFPENHKKKYYGRVSMDEAFAQSLNSVAIQISEAVKIKNVVKMAKKMGITSHLDKDDPTIALGTMQVSLLELTSSYAVLVNNGGAVIPYAIEKITSEKNNKIIYERKTDGLNKILDDSIVFNMQKMMKNVILKGTGKNIIKGNDKIKGLNIGGKTGTTQRNADAWFIGYVGDMVIGVWVGNDDNSSMKEMTGGDFPTEIWKRIVEKLM